jgi:hypothetical protein
MNQRQLQMIEYLREENRVLREQLGNRRLRLSDDQRRRLAAKAKGIGRKLLSDIATIVTPETLLRWHSRLILRNTMAVESEARADREPLSRSNGWWFRWRGRTVNGDIAGFRAHS